MRPRDVQPKFKRRTPQYAPVCGPNAPQAQPNPCRTVRTLLLSCILLWAPLAMAAQDLEQAMEAARASTGGKILSAETVQQGRRPVYRIKVLTPEGQVRVLQFSADRSNETRGTRPPRPRRPQSD